MKHWDVSEIHKRIGGTVAVALGSPAEVVRLLVLLEIHGAVCYQMDDYQGDRLRNELQKAGLQSQVVTSPDLWDLPGEFQTVLYPVPPGGERSLKLDLVEQAYHLLGQRGNLIVMSPYKKDDFFAPLLKKVFGKFHAHSTSTGQIFWAARHGNRPRRRHEMTFHVRMSPECSLRFLSRPGVFSYGRFDHGARALVETMTIRPGDRILDMGCGCGTNGAWAGKLTGEKGHVAFADSNARALALADWNARLNGLQNFEVLSSGSIDKLPAGSFNVALANPPYYAQGTIAQNFVHRCRQMLGPGGRFYLVTKQTKTVGPFVVETFGNMEVASCRGYQVLCAKATDDKTFAKDT